MSEQRTVDWPLMARTVIEVEGSLGDTYNRFWDYSTGNLALFVIQGMRGPVASYSRWKALGNPVKAGARAKEVIVPVLVSEAPPEETLEEKRERVGRLIGFKVVRAVFEYADTVGREIPPRPLPGWSFEQMFSKLGIREVPFDETRGNLQGYSRGTEIAINPMAVRPDKTRLHETAHVVAGDTLPHSMAGDEDMHRGHREWRAEFAAYLVLKELNMLDEDTDRVMRGYCQHWTDGEAPPDRIIQQSFTVADRILKAGRVDTPIVTPITPETAADPL